MSDHDDSKLVDELLSALETAGAVEHWLDQRALKPGDEQRLTSAYRQVTLSLLGYSAPKTDAWEHLLLATAARSAKSNQEGLCEACRVAIDELTRMIQDDRIETTATEHVVTLASALTIVLSAQRRLRQPVELATSALNERFPDCVSEMAERCQDIWQLHGQMSGFVGLYVWDTRRNEWRLNQDFKPHRPT